MVKYEGILFYSDDIWNNNREGDFSNAEVVLQPNIDTGECETYYPCALYYEKEATDSLGYTCLDINSDKYEGLDIFKITLRNKSGAVSTLMLPKSTRKFPVAFGGLQGTAVSFYIDGVETYKKANRDKAVKFIKNRLEKLRECESPFQAESSAMIVEEMASEFSVERINPTVVSGQSDMKAESFAAENLAVADVDIHDGMNIPAGSGSIVGQAIPETDFTPFGASAESCACGANETCMCAETDVIPNEPDMSAIIGQTSDGQPYTPFGYAAENLAVADVEVWDGMVLPEGTGAIIGQATPATDYTPFGVSAESYMEETFKPDGMGEVVGAITAETDYTPFGASAESGQMCEVCFGNDDLPYDSDHFTDCGRCEKSVCMDCDGEMESHPDWFKVCGECNTVLENVSIHGAEAFGGDLASLNDFNGVNSVVVQAPLGHGVTQDLGAEMYSGYGGMLGVAAAFVAGVGFRYWSGQKLNGDESPDSSSQNDVKDSSQE